MNNEVKCPKCDNLIRLDQANFCGMCGTNVINIKQHYQQMQQQQMQQQQMQQQQMQQQQMQQQQMYQQQMHQQQMHQQQMHQQHNKKNHNSSTKLPFHISFFYHAFKFMFWILLSFFIYRCAVDLNHIFIDNVMDYGIDPSLFYIYFSDEVVEDDIYYFAGGISNQEYYKLKNGMSYALASFIIGGDGDLVNTGENVHNKFYYTYRWYSEIDENLVYYITFVDDEINEIMLDQN